MPRIDYFFSTLSPFSYLAGTRLEAIAARHGAQVVYRPMNIMALFQATGGTPVPERHPSRQAYRLTEIRRIAEFTGLPVTPRPRHWPTNPVPSSAAIIAAQDAGGGDTGRLAHGLLAACWAEERDIAEDAVIRDCLAAAGFDPGLAERAIFSGADQYERNTHAALEAGVFGAPSYILDTELFWGQDRLEHLDRRLAAG